jgi:hypothetical protein
LAYPQKYPLDRPGGKAASALWADLGEKRRFNAEENFQAFRGLDNLKSVPFVKTYLGVAVERIQMGDVEELLRFPVTIVNATKQILLHLVHVLETTQRWPTCVHKTLFGLQMFRAVWACSSAFAETHMKPDWLRANGHLEDQVIAKWADVYCE